MALRTPKDRLTTPLDPSPLGGHNVSMMSFQEFEQLPPLPEECSELPAMWEDGGALDSGREGYSVGGSFDDEPQWGSLPNDSSVKIFADGDPNAENSEIHHNDSLEQRSSLIEQTLSEIYASPFPKLMYADSQSPSHTDPNPRPSRKTSFKTPDPTDSTPPNRSRAVKDNVSESGKVVLGKEDKETEALSEEEADKREERGVLRLSHDAHGPVKASIARAAQRAVSGYRTCDDADSYVGAQVKPTLILARAPPSPSGILRRTNKKSSAKVTQGSVRWADGKPPSLPPTEDSA